MDEVTRLALEANSEVTTLRKGQVIHVEGLPCELLADVQVFTATTIRRDSAPQEGEGS